MDGIALTDTTENPVAVIQNPAGSGKSLFLFNRKVTTDNNNVLMRFYFNPVLNVPGSLTAALNLRSGATLASISKCYLGASITSNGTFISILPAISLLIISDILLIIDPGNSLLITGQQESSGTTNVYAENSWYEI